MYLTDRPVGVLARSIAAVIPMGRWTLEVRISTAVALPMDRWALEVRGFIVAVVPMDRWVLEVRISTAVALPMDRWALEVRGFIVAVLPMDRWALEIKQIHRCCLTDGPMGDGIIKSLRLTALPVVRYFMQFVRPMILK
ncbi:hypothetical protein DEO72_LG1g2623 [Vigna unguiculata]|uniref:Uncharacterized protein n=1 Tax=Vigna unguiculata TaxID=3917 RepID=A0A4D6KLR9_VIGUN|nr:hypothetical protein DEO72_LG1g2623 [Vigna unguiculata]